jgi:hypothetical protein
MCLLYELGLILARLLPKRAEDDDEYRSPSDAQLDSELDRIDGKP